MTDTRPLVVYLLCVIATPLLSEFPLHILEVVDEEDAVTATGESLIEQKVSKPGHEKSLESPSDHNSVPHSSNVNNNRNDVDATARRNTTYGTMLAIVSIPLLYMLRQVLAFTWRMQISKRESLVYQCFCWTLTLGTAPHLMYGLSACARFYVFVFRPAWLPEGILLRVQTFQLCVMTLALVIHSVSVVVACLLVKILVYDNLVKLVVNIIGIGDS